MGMAMRWRRTDAEHWVHVLLIVQTVALSLLVFVFDVRGLVAGISPLLLLFLVILPAAAGWLSSAWRRERPWAWWVLTPLSVLLLPAGLDDLLTVGPSWLRTPRLVFYGVLLLLLAHPDSRARIQPVRADAGLPGRPAGTGRVTPVRRGCAGAAARPSWCGRAGC